MARKTPQTGSKPRKGTKQETFKSYSEIEQRFLPNRHEQTKQERNRRQPGVYGTGLALDIFDKARQQAS